MPLGSACVPFMVAGMCENIKACLELPSTNPPNSMFCTAIGLHAAAHMHVADVLTQVVLECNNALGWLEEKQALQAGLRKTDEPLLRAADSKKKAETLSRVCHPLMSKPPPPVSTQPCASAQHMALVEAA